MRTMSHPRVLIAAKELADSIGLDVDTFISCAVLALRDDQRSGGRRLELQQPRNPQWAMSYRWPIGAAGYAVRMKDPPLVT